MENYDTPHNYNTNAYDTISMIQQNHQNARFGMKANNLYSGWGFSAQQQPEMPNTKIPPKEMNPSYMNNYLEAKDIEFERAIPGINHEAEYQQPRNKSPGSYSEMNFDNQKIDVRNSFMFTGANAPSVISMHDDKSYHTVSNNEVHGMNKEKEYGFQTYTPTHSEPVDHERSIVTTNVFEKAMMIRLKTYDQESYKKNLIVKVDKQYNTSNQKQFLSLELTDQIAPKFLYTSRIGETEYAIIKEKLSLRIDLQNFDKYLCQNLDKCIESQETNDNYNFTICELQTSKAVTAVFTIKECNGLQDTKRVEIIFDEAQDGQKLDYMSKQILELKQERKNLREEFKKTSESYSTTLNRGEVMMSKVTHLEEIKQQHEDRIESLLKEFSEHKESANIMASKAIKSHEEELNRIKAHYQQGKVQITYRYQHKFL